MDDKYNFTADALASKNNPQLIKVTKADYFTKTASNNNSCKLTFKTYFKNGTEATLSNSQFGNVDENVGLYLTSSQGFSFFYYL